MSDDDNAILDFTIVVPDVHAMLKWADENIPGRLQRASAYELEDGRFSVRLRVCGGAQATGLKLVWHNTRA